MPLTAFRFPLREDADERRFRRLTRHLQSIQGEIAREAAGLRLSGERMTDCAAFSFEAMENGEHPERMSAKVDALTRELAINRGQLSCLELQMSFIDKTRAGLASILSPHGDQA